MADCPPNNTDHAAGVHDSPEDATPEAARTAHKHEKLKSVTVIRPDGTKVITFKRRKSLPDGSLLSKTRTEKFSAATDSDVATTHVIKTKTKRINSDDGRSYSTTTTELMKEYPPVVHTKVLADGSRIIRSKQTTLRPVTTTTTVHLTKIPVTFVTSLQNVDARTTNESQKLNAQAEPHIEICDEDSDGPIPFPYIGTVVVEEEYEGREARKKAQAEPHRDVRTAIETCDDDSDGPMPPQYIDTAEEEECDDREAQKKIMIEELPDEEPIPHSLEDTNDHASMKSSIKASFRKIFGIRAVVAPLPVELEANGDVSREPNEPTPSQSEPNDAALEESLAMARPVSPEEDGPIYEAEKYTPTVRTPFYTRRREMCWTAFALLVCSIVVAVSVVYATKGVVEEQTPPPIVDERAASGIQQFIQANVLQRNASFDSIGKNDPRRSALDWILYEDSTQMEVHDKRLSQRYVIALLAFSFDSLAWTFCGNGTLGNDGACNISDKTGQKEHSAWLSNKNECSWYGVNCSDDDSISGLILNDNGLVGEILPEIGKLNLTILSLKQNCLFGSVPHAIGHMQHLMQLELDQNGLSGALPDEIMELKRLEKLNLAEQYLHEHECTRSDGTVVNTLFARGDEANGENQGLEGQILGPKIGNLRALKEIAVNWNYFYGTIASEIGRLKDLVVLNAGSNAFNGTIPPEITMLTGLRQLRLAENWISGELPHNIGNMKSLEVLELGHGYTVGSIGGTIPDSLYDVSSLKELMLNNNEPGFQGPIKTDIGRLTQLAHLDISDNPLLTGTLPSELGLCKELAFLNLANSGIYGRIPQEVCDLREKKLHSENRYEFFRADCSPSEGSSVPFVTCDCCNTCCDHETKECILVD